MSKISSLNLLEIETTKDQQVVGRETRTFSVYRLRRP